MNGRRRANGAYLVQKRFGKTARVGRDLFAAEASLSLARNALDDAERAIATAPLEALLGECADAAIAAMLPSSIGAVIALHEQLVDLVARLHSDETLPLARLVGALGDTIPGFGWSSTVIGAGTRVASAHRRADARAAEARMQVVEIRDRIRSIRLELGRLGRRGVLFERIA